MGSPKGKERGKNVPGRESDFCEDPELGKKLIWRKRGELCVEVRRGVPRRGEGRGGDARLSGRQASWSADKVGRGWAWGRWLCPS